MNFQEIEMRDATSAYNLPDDPKNQRILANNIIAPYRFVMLMGLSSCGKSTFLNAYTGRKGWSLTKWNRDNIFDMVFQDGTRVDKYYGYVTELESKLFPELYIRERHQIVVEGWNRKLQGRKRYLNYITKGMGRTAVIVFDGPIEKIVNRNLASGHVNLSGQELPIFLKDQHRGIQWPKFEEGWDSIYYINSFGAPGTTYLKDRLEFA